MKDLRLHLDGAFDRVGDETILFGFFQNSRHARRDRWPKRMTILGFHDDLGDLIAASLNFFQFPLAVEDKLTIDTFENSAIASRVSA